MEFVPFPKMGRLTRDCIITEKLDGTNAQIAISEDGKEIRAGSRKRWITPQDDNYGFAGWVERNREELLLLGPGRHFGEWWGSGIQSGYGLTGGDKRFSLFNVTRWEDPASRPSCCGVVPVLYRGLFSTNVADNMIERLRHEGSLAAPGFMRPEGIVIFHTATGVLMKKTILKDEAPKTSWQEAA